MSDEVVRLSVVGHIVRRRWRQLVVLALLGAVLGAGASQLFSPGYTSTSSVLLQGPLEEEELQTEAQIAMSSVVLDRTAAAIGPGISGAQLQDSVSAAVLDGNLIAIKASADTPERAQQLTQRLTQEYITFSTELVRRATGASAQVLERLQQQIADANSRIIELQQAAPAAGAQQGTELEQLRTTLADAVTALEGLGATGPERGAAAAFGAASILVLEPAGLPSSPAQPTLVQFIGGGALLFPLLGVFAHLVAARADRRLWTGPDIAAAVGAPVVGNVDVPDGPTVDGRPVGPRGWRARLRRLVRDDRPWGAAQPPLPGNDLDRNVRYRRLLARLRGAPDTVLRLLVLVADDDDTAHRAVAQLAVTAAAAGGPASVVTDREGFSRLVRATCDRAGASNVSLSIRSSSEPAPGPARTVLRVIDVSAARPTVPDCGRVAGTLVVLTAGTRTGWELVGIAEACADAGHRVLGAFVTHPAGVGARPAEPTRPDSSHASRNGTAMAGTT